VKDELERLGRIVDLLASEPPTRGTSVTELRSRCPMDVSPNDLLAELRRVVKYAGAYVGAVVIEWTERNRAGKLQRELDERAVSDQELLAQFHL
jgi:hypothetical protein